MLNNKQPAGLECVFLALCAAILAKQLLLPGFIGLADNGDFAKVAGHLKLQAADYGQDFFAFFQPRYLRNDAYYYDWHIPSSEIPIAFAASALERRFGDPSSFDIRWLGAIHAVIFAAAYYLILLLTRPFRWWLRALLALLALMMFADAGVVSYFNSFSMDAAALLGAFAMVALAVNLLWRPGVHTGLLIAFACAAVLYCTSKPPHAPLAVIPAAFVLAVVWRAPGRMVRATGVLLAACILAAAVWVLLETPDVYKVPTEFEVVFYRIANDSRTPADKLRELGLDETYLPWVGLRSYEKGWPGEDPAWGKQFLARTNYGRILRYYAAHPVRTAGFLWLDLRAASVRRPRYIGNFQRTSGRPPKTQAHDFGWWSDLATRVGGLFPAGVALWHCGILLAGPILAARMRPGLPRALAWGLVMTSSLACGEFLVNSLGDAFNVERHVCVFHLFTDLTFFLAIMLGASLTTDASRRLAFCASPLPSE